MSLVVTIPTMYYYEDSNIDWLIKILSKDIRLCFLPVMGIVLYPREKIFWICLFLLCLNIPTTIADMTYIDKYDNAFVLWKTVLILMLAVLIAFEFNPRAKQYVDEKTEEMITKCVGIIDTTIKYLVLVCKNMLNKMRKKWRKV